MNLRLNILSKAFCDSPIEALNLSGRVPSDSRIATSIDRAAAEACPECERARQQELRAQQARPFSPRAL